MSKQVEFKLTSEFIELNKLLKFEGLVYNGGEANTVITEKLVEVNGEIETRKRRKLRSGDSVMFENVEIKIA